MKTLFSFLRSTFWEAMVVCFVLVATSLFVDSRIAACAEYDRESDRHQFTVLMREGGWCWFQDPRAIIHNSKLIMGAVQGNGLGPAQVGVYDLEKQTLVGTSVMNDSFDRDDHNSPVFYTRSDGGLLAMYALHSRNRAHYYRFASAEDPLRWSKEFTYDHDYPNSGNVTYMNLFYLSEEEKLYNFFRGIEFNPSYITSTDEGRTWGEPTHLIGDELQGRHRPYTRYASNGKDAVHISFTDAHPHDFGNSIFYAEFRGGNFYRAGGAFIKNLKKDGPLKPSEAEEVFRGSRELGPKGHASANRSAWTSSLAIDDQGYPHIGYILHLSNSDHRYRIAHWNGRSWDDREVAFAGSCLYDTQTSYTGLISLDPGDPTTILISTNVDPTTGLNNGREYEIYRASIGARDDVNSIDWDVITRNSPVRNIRPIIVRGDGYRVFAWLRGDYRSFTDYQLDVVGVTEKLKE